jgi:uncharacterized protein YjbI with pentapeptide repeats
MADPEHLDILKEGVDAWNEWREENPQEEIDLSHADLTGFDLANINAGGNYEELRDFLYNHYRENIPVGEDLVRFAKDNLDLDDEFWDISPPPVDFSYACLEKANLEGADLKEAMFFHANLKRANLSKANLEHANLVYADLSDAELTESKMASVRLGGTIFGANDISCVTGLDKIIHKGPSIIGVKTLELSSGKIPLKFLRGAGLSENTIRAVLPLYTEVSDDYFSCFISYNHKDIRFARRLYELLQNRGIRCWLDEHQLLPGDDIYEGVDRGIRTSDKILLCCSEHSLTSWWVDTEIDTAFDKERKLMQEQRKKVISLIPLNLDGYMFGGKWESGKERLLKSRHIADFTGWESDSTKFDKQFEKIVQVLRKT